MWLNLGPIFCLNFLNTPHQSSVIFSSGQFLLVAGEVVMINIYWEFNICSSLYKTLSHSDLIC